MAAGLLFVVCGVRRSGSSEVSGDWLRRGVFNHAACGRRGRPGAFDRGVFAELARAVAPMPIYGWTVAPEGVGVSKATGGFP